MGSKDRERRKQQAAKRRKSEGLKGEVATVARWPISGAWVTAGWQAQGSGIVVLARRHPYDGREAIASWYVDLWCMGVKKTRFDPNADRYALLEQLSGGVPLEPCAPELVAAIIEAGAAYGESLGLPQAKELPALREMLRDLDPDKVAPVETGKDGKPLYMPGPDDNVAGVLVHLQRRLGPGGFHFAGPLPG
jgi:hypothetical protein